MSGTLREILSKRLLIGPLETNQGLRKKLQERRPFLRDCISEESKNYRILQFLDFLEQIKKDLYEKPASSFASSYDSLCFWDKKALNFYWKFKKDFSYKEPMTAYRRRDDGQHEPDDSINKENLELWDKFKAESIEILARMVEILESIPTGELKAEDIDLTLDLSDMLRVCKQRCWERYNWELRVDQRHLAIEVFRKKSLLSLSGVEHFLVKCL